MRYLIFPCQVVFHTDSGHSFSSRYPPPTPASMKASSLVWSLVSLLTTHTLAASPDLKLESTSNTKSPITDPDSVPSTFNGIEVPPIPLLTPDNYEEMLKDGYWYACLPHLLLIPIVVVNWHVVQLIIPGSSNTTHLFVLTAKVLLQHGKRFTNFTM